MNPSNTLNHQGTYSCLVAYMCYKFHINNFWHQVTQHKNSQSEWTNYCACTGNIGTHSSLVVILIYYLWWTIKLLKSCHFLFISRCTTHVQTPVLLGHTFVQTCITCATYMKHLFYFHCECTCRIVKIEHHNRYLE